MGSPLGHPFRGNQYVDSEGTSRVLPLIFEVVEKVTEVSSELPIMSVAKPVGKQLCGNNLVGKIYDILNNKNNLIAAAALTVAAFGGILVFRHIKKKKQLHKDSGKKTEAC